MHIDEYSRETNEALSDPVFGERNGTLFRAFKRAGAIMKHAHDIGPFLSSYKMGTSIMMACGDPRIAEWDKNKEELNAAIITAVEKQIDNNGGIRPEHSLHLAEAALNAVLTFKPKAAAPV